MAQIRIMVGACARAGLFTSLMILAGVFVLPGLGLIGSASAPRSGNAVASKTTKNLTITITSADGRMKGGDNDFCRVFQKRGTEEPIDVQNVSVEFTLLVGKIQEKPIETRLTADRVGQYCGHVDLGKQYYVPASYYAFVRFTDSAGKKSKDRLFLSIK